MLTLNNKLKNLTQRELVVFDFDETLVDCNSDTWIYQLAPGKELPEHLEYRHGQDYFQHVQGVLAYLHSQKVREEDYYECLSQMPSVPGMFEKLVDELVKEPERYDMIILSDSNSFFISSYLKAKSYENAFKAILTNPARFSTDDKKLLVKEYHIQEYCNLSARNLCKGEALKNFIGKQMLDHNTVYTCVNYVGDGENDLCPSAKLSARDRIFPRQGYALSRLCSRLKKGSSSSERGRLPELKALVVPWTTGEEILNVITAGSDEEEEPRN